MNVVYDYMDPKMPMLADVTVARLGEVYDKSKPGQYSLKVFTQAVQKAQAVCPETIDSYQVLAAILATQDEYKHSTVVVECLRRAGTYLELVFPQRVERLFTRGGYLINSENVRITQERLLELLSSTALKELRVHDCIHDSGPCLFSYKEVMVNGRFV